MSRVLACPHGGCGARMDLDLLVGDISIDERPTQPSHRVKLDDFEIEFRVPRGYLGRPWWGLIAFAVADGINIFFWIGGYNWLSDQVYYSLDLFSNVAYVAGYLITALAFLAAHEHIERGITASASSR